MTPSYRYEKEGITQNPENVEQQSRGMPGFFKKQDQNANKFAAQEDIQEVKDKGYKIASSSATLPIADASQIGVGGSKQLVHSVAESSVLNFLKERCPDILTDDVVNNKAFMTMLCEPIESMTEYERINLAYITGKAKQSQTSELSKIIKYINGQISVLDKQLNDASKLEINLSAGLTQVNILCAIKQGKLTDISKSAWSIREKIRNTSVFSKLSKRIKQQARSAKKSILPQQGSTTVECCNTGLTWDEAYLSLETKIIRGTYVPKLSLLNLAARIHDEFLLKTDEISAESASKREVIISQLLQNFPILRATNKEKANKDVLVNVHELLLSPDSFDILLGADKDVSNEPDNQTIYDPTEEAVLVTEGPTRCRGKEPYWLKFPELVETATNFIKLHSFSAHNRRRETTGTGTGVSLRDLQCHLLDKVPGLKEKGISLDTIHHLMVAPKKNSGRAGRYKGLVDAKIAKKRNQYREESENQHFIFSRVNYREEMCAMYENECRFYSSDDMNKLRMGPATAVSRYHQQQRFFARDNTPNLWDHDFPNSGYLLATSGYQMQCKRNEEREDEISEEYTSPELNDLSIPLAENAQDGQDLSGKKHSNINGKMVISDKLGRPHIQKTTYGPALLLLRACKFKQSSGATHANDLLPILRAQVQEGKGVAFVKVDNGSDWNLLSVVNSLYLCRLWRDSGLDILGIVSYAARYSAYNQIEHLWSPMSKKLTSVILPSVLEGEEEPPCRQSDISDEERRMKEAVVFDKAMDLVKSRYWGGAKFNGSEVTTHYKPCLEEEHPYSDYKETHKLLTGPIAHARNNKEITKELRFLTKHVDRKSNELIFMKCYDPRCAFCVQHPVKAVQVWNFLRERDFKWFNPVPSTSHQGHYKTFLEMLEMETTALQTGDANLPCSISLDRCPFCPSYLFMSEAEKKRHLDILHHDKKILEIPYGRRNIAAILLSNRKLAGRDVA